MTTWLAVGGVAFAAWSVLFAFLAVRLGFHQRLMQVRGRRVSLFADAVRGDDAQEALVEDVYVGGALGREDLHGVPRLLRGMGDGQHRLGPAAEAQVGDAGVLDLAVAEAHPCGQAADRRHGPQEVQEHLDAVASEVHHRPPARLALLQEPRARVAGRRVEELEGLDLDEHR